MLLLVHLYQKMKKLCTDTLERLTRKDVEALLAIMRSVVATILSFLDKAVGLVAEHTWVLIYFVAGLIGLWLMQNVKK